MRIHASRCHSFTYRITTPGPCAVELEQSAAVRPFFDCLVLRVGIDRDDSAVAGTAAAVIKHLAAESDSGFIVLDGYARWATTDRCAAGLDVLTGLADALDVLAELTERLEERGELVHQMPFGWSTWRRAHVVDGAWAHRVVDVGAHTRNPALPPTSWSLTPRTRRPCGVISR
ncbi:hypothetical protein [Nocardia blacklockiae]|uniref:hypothetical protein n=1 Tax=Nocardia blacklockiae TaxID=480036 RepID=UPI0018956627|nr:hypothetical protein [Nocardia blacklockiae]MBF6171386.1 hypothetical protein [Nocardia blacklockiae]